MRRGIVIAIDGPAGSGKSSVARALAGRLGLKYVNTGVMYRAVGLYFRDRLALLNDGSALTTALRGCRIRLVPGVGGGAGKVVLNGRDVTASLGSSAAGSLASRVSSFPEVRRTLVALQKGMAYHPGVVMEGRDIASVVFPDAEVKIYLTAGVTERARRRAKELRAGGRRVLLRVIESDIRSRDRRDRSRALAPLRKTPGSLFIRTTRLSKQEVIDRLERRVRQRLGLNAADFLLPYAPSKTP
ncbi:MAG: (d)CMP kinase [Nitrospirae bacterium]|nr:(d)CMP kinase [Nitrospirota bacterium]